MKLTPKQVENTRMAYAIMSGIPAKRINLNNWRLNKGRGWSIGCSDPISNERFASRRCGSVGCIGGWLSAHPYFVAQGLTYDPEARALGRPTISLRGVGDVSAAARKLFGKELLFNCGNYGLEGKRQALARLRLHLYAGGAITEERNAELAAQEARMKS